MATVNTVKAASNFVVRGLRTKASKSQLASVGTYFFPAKNSSKLPFDVRFSAGKADLLGDGKIVDVVNIAFSHTDLDVYVATVVKGAKQACQVGIEGIAMMCPKGKILPSSVFSINADALYNASREIIQAVSKSRAGVFKTGNPFK